MDAYGLKIDSRGTHFVLASSFKHYLQMVVEDGAQLGATLRVRPIGNNQNGTYQMHYFTFDQQQQQRPTRYVSPLEAAGYGDIYNSAGQFVSADAFLQYGRSYGQSAGPAYLLRGREPNTIAEQLCGPVNLGARLPTERGREGPVYVFVRSQQPLPFVEMLGDAGQMLNIIRKVVQTEQDRGAAPITPAPTEARSHAIEYLSRALTTDGHEALIKEREAGIAAAEANLADKLAVVDAANEALREVRDPDYAAKQQALREAAAEHAQSSTDPASAAAPMDDVVASGKAGWPPAKPFELPPGATTQILLGRVGIDDQPPVPAIAPVSDPYHLFRGPNQLSQLSQADAWQAVRSYHSAATDNEVRDMMQMRQLYPNASVDQLPTLVMRHRMGWIPPNEMTQRERVLASMSNAPPHLDWNKVHTLEGHASGPPPSWGCGRGNPLPSPLGSQGARAGYPSPLPNPAIGVEVRHASAFPPAPTVRAPHFLDPGFSRPPPNGVFGSMSATTGEPIGQPNPFASPYGPSLGLPASTVPFGAPPSPSPFAAKPAGAGPPFSKQ